MTLPETMYALRQAGTAQNRKVYARHGVLGEQFGVSYAELGKFQKKIGKVEVDHGQTSCKTPDAASYMAKVLAHRAKGGAKRKRTGC